MNLFYKKNFNKIIPKDYKRYDEVLNDDEILKCALLIDKYKKGTIDFNELLKEAESIGITIKPILIDFSTKMETIEQRKVIKERLDNNNYIYEDIRGFLLDIDDKKVIFYMDYKAIEILAKAGLPDYIVSIISILEWEIRNTPNSEIKKMLKAKRTAYLSRLHNCNNSTELEGSKKGKK